MTELEKFIYNKKRSNYKKTELSLYDRFWADEKESEAWLKQALSLQQEKDIAKRKEKLTQLSRGGELSINFNKQAIDKLIDRFTKASFTDEEIDKIIEAYNKLGIFTNGRRVDREALVFELDGKKTVVRTLSVASPGLLNYFPELQTNDRTCRCHEGSIQMARALGLEGRRVTTGSYFILSPMSMVLHSVAEVEIGGDPYVVDYESNTLWERDDFYKFYNFEPFESLPWETIEKDMDNLVFLANIDKDYTKLYLTSRDEAMAIASKLQNQNENK